LLWEGSESAFALSEVRASALAGHGWSKASGGSSRGGWRREKSSDDLGATENNLDVMFGCPVERLAFEASFQCADHVVYQLLGSLVVIDNPDDKICQGLGTKTGGVMNFRDGRPIARGFDIGLNF
jgi:hypothetical protein